MARVTLIIGVLTDQYVALVSDRRTTWTENGKVIRQEDTDTKTISLRGQFLMGFTGRARLDGLRIEAWASQKLRDAKPEDYFAVLGLETDTAFRRMRIDGKEPHAYLAVGYASLEPGGHVYPMRVIVSNSIDNNGRFVRDALASGFRMHVTPLGNRGQLVAAVGWRVGKATIDRLSSQIHVVRKGDPSNPALTIGPLVYALRETAKNSDECVGDAALFASLPRRGVPDHSMTSGVFSALDFRNKATSLYLPSDKRRPEDAVWHSAAVIGPGLHVMGASVYSGVRPPSLPESMEGWRV
jgi:hypothetical protein